MALLGSKQCNVDAKGRLMLPADFRKQLDGTVCLIPLKDALYGFALADYENWVNSFFNRDGKEFDPRDRGQVKLRRLLTSHTAQVDLDSAGRVALGKVDASEPGARERLGLGRDVTVVGSGDHFEVWNTERWNAENADFADEIDALMFGA